MLTTEAIERLVQQHVAVHEDTLRCAGRGNEEIHIETERLRRELQADYATWLLRTSYPDTRVS